MKQGHNVEPMHQAGGDGRSPLPISSASGSELLTQRLTELLRVANRALKLVSPVQEKALETMIYEIGAHKLLDTLGVTGMADPEKLKALLEQEPNPMAIAVTQEGQASILQWSRKHWDQIRRWRDQARTLTRSLLASYTDMPVEPGDSDPEGVWTRRAGDALRDLKDVSALNRNPLARTKAVEALAEERYRAHIVRRGFALREIVLQSVEEVIGQLSTEPSLARMCMYLKLAAQGISATEIGQELGLSREHVSRTYRRQALGLLGHRLRARLRG